MTVPRTLVWDLASYGSIKQGERYVHAAEFPHGLSWSAWPACSGRWCWHRSQVLYHSDLPIYAAFAPVKHIQVLTPPPLGPAFAELMCQSPCNVSLLRYLVM